MEAVEQEDTARSRKPHTTRAEQRATAAVRRAKTVELREAGAGVQEIADQLGVSLGTVHADLNPKDKPPRPPKEPKPTPAKSGRPEEIPLDRIRLDGETQPRSRLEVAVVNDYAEAIERGAKFPPLELVHDGKDYWLWDGFHRWHAAAKAKKNALKANVRPGTVEDARWLALSANQVHGLRRCNEDKRRAVEAALKQRPNESDRAIAAHVGVSNVFVSGRRPQVLTVNTSEPATRTGIDGKQYPAGKPKPRAAEPTTPQATPTPSTPFTPTPRPADPPVPAEGDAGPVQVNDKALPEEVKGTVHPRDRDISAFSSRLGMVMWYLQLLSHDELEVVAKEVSGLLCMPEAPPCRA